MVTFTESVYGVLESKVAAGLDCLHRMPDHVGSGLRDSPDRKQGSADEFYTWNEEKIREGTWVVTDEFEFRRQ